MTQPKPANDAGPAEARPDTAAMTDRQLAQAVLDRTIRPRVSEVRRLAEAVAKKGGKKSSKKGSRPKAGKSGRKLAKIPGQKKKKA